MRELVEFRVIEEFASRLFAPHEGKRLGTSVRKVEIGTDDPRFQRVGELQREIKRATGRSFFLGWNVRRHYTPAELDAAASFRLKIIAVFEPAGEERGTKYDESFACPSCGSGGKQIGSLVLDLKRIPRGKDIAKTIAGEVVVSRRLAELFTQQGVSGVTFGPIRMNAASSAESKDWFQLLVVANDVDVIDPTRVGINPFDEDQSGEYRCPRGDLIGLNLLSEVTVKTRPACDFAVSRQFIGGRRGLLRPEPVVIVSPKVWKLFELEGVKGAGFEVAHVT